MTGTADLRSEHRAVGRMLDIMDKMAASAREGERLRAEDLHESVEFLRVFVDSCHHAKEEQLLFPAMRAAEVPSADDVLADLLADHVLGREIVVRLASLVARAEAADRSAGAELAQTIEAYTLLLRDHIGREERDCFEPADRALPPDVQHALIEGYERIEVEVVGGGVHERFHALLDRLAHAYRM